MIRFAEEKDLERINELRRQVNDMHVKGRPDIFKPGFGREMQDLAREILEGEEGNIIVAEQDGSICGMVCVSYITKPESPYNLGRKIYHVEEIAVDEGVRRQGVGTELLEFMKRDAKERWFDRIELDVWEFNKSAIGFYEKNGFVMFRRFMECRVSDKIFAETERLRLRQMEPADYGDLCKILKDEEVMYEYEGAFSDEEVRSWLDKQFVRYKEDGFGLFAVILKETGEMIGQCGLTLQDIPGRQVLEIGYLFQKRYWHQGYATEAAKACKEYAFTVLKADEVFSIIRDSNIASQNVAKRNGMTQGGTFIKHYRGVDMPHYIFSVKNQ